MTPEVLVPDLTTRTFKLLLGGYINVNVIDGSAFFLSGLVGMCARQPEIATTLVTANPLRRTEVLQEILHYSNVDVLDPYSDIRIQGKHFAPKGDSMTRAEYAKLLGETFQNGNFDSALVRDTETGFHLVKNYPDIASRFSVYVTGVTSLDDPPGDALIDQLRAIVRAGARLVCQTRAMATQVRLLDVGVEEDAIFILPPHVPDAEGAFDDIYHFSQSPSRLVYTGKFFKAWNADKILASFKAVKSMANNALSLEVAGDQFRNDPEDPYFVKNVKYLLMSSDGLHWHGRVPREVSRQLIERSHVGIGWRAAELDRSSELSTKILEYGAMGRPSVLNRTPLHEELLGNDYPLFANTTTEFKQLLASLGSMGNEVEEAARRCYRLSQSHWYSVVLSDLMNHLGNTRMGGSSNIAFAIGPSMLVNVPGEMLHQKAKAELNGMWLRLSFDTTSSSTVGQLVTAVQFYFDSWTHVSALAKEQLVKAGDIPPALTSYGATPTSRSDEPVVTSSTDSVLNRLKASEQHVKDLEDELRVLRQKVDLVKRVVKKLDSSKYGRPAVKVLRKVKRKLA